MNRPEDEEAVEVESTEESIDVLTGTAYKCTSCFDTFASSEIKNTDTCPTCGEETLMEA